METENNKLPARTVYQWWQCSCGTKYFGILEETKVNIFDDRLEHTGYFAEEEAWQESLIKARKCPKPKDPGCGCQVHTQIPFHEFSGQQAWYSYDQTGFPVQLPFSFTTTFQLNSVDYLLKPIDYEELSAALDKFEEIYPTGKEPGGQIPFRLEDIRKLILQP